MPTGESSPASTSAIASIAAATGGVIGASARWAANEMIGAPGSSGFPWSTLTVNVLGCMLIGMTAMRVTRDSVAWALLVTGVLGGFTTMSAFAIELNDFAADGRRGIVAAYLAATLAGGLAALLVGERAAASMDGMAG